MANEALGNRVREDRRARRTTQAELAAAVGVSRQTVVAIEGGDYAPSVLLALRISAALHTPVDQLFYIHPSNDPSVDPPHQEVPS